MADQSVSWDEVEVQWDNVADEVEVQCDNVVPSRIRAKETSRSLDLGPATGKSARKELEITSVPDRGAVYRDSSLSALAGEDPDATLPYDLRCFSTLVPQELGVAEAKGGSGITLVPQSRASMVESEAIDVSVSSKLTT